MNGPLFVVGAAVLSAILVPAMAQTENLTELLLQENPDFNMTVSSDAFEGFLKILENQTETREAIPSVEAPSPVRFDVPPEGIPAANIPFPTVGQIEIQGSNGFECIR